MGAPVSRLLSIALALAVCAPLVAQQYHVYRYGQLDGLPSSQIYTVEQAPDGVIWTATGTGIVSYDGGTWRRHHGPPDGSWRKVVPGADGSFWAITEHAPVHVARGGLAEQTDAEWDVSPKAPLPQDVEPTALAVSEQNAAIIGTLEHGVAVYANDKWHRLKRNGELDFRGRTVACHGDTLHVGCADGLWQFDLTQLDREGTKLPGFHDGPVLGLAYEGDLLWIVQRQWLGQLKSDGTIHTVLESDMIGPHQARVALEPDRRGSVFLGNYLGIHRVSTDGSINTWGRTQGLLDDTATDFEVDHEGNLWIASLRGLSKVSDDDVVGYTAAHGMYADEVSAICKRGDSRYVVGHEGGLTLLENGERSTIAIDGKPAEARVLDLEPGPDGRIWIAASWRGLGELSATNEITWHDNLAQVQAVVVTAEGVMVGTNSGLWRFEKGQWHRSKHDQPLLHKPLRRLQLEGDGTLWGFTSKQGAWRLQPGGTLQQWLPDHTAQRDVYSTIEWGGRRLIGSRAGLLEVTSDTLVPATPLIDCPVYTFAVDEPSESLWIGTSRGVAVLRDDKVKWHTPSTGLLGHEVNRDALLIDGNGLVCIGTNGGLNVTHARTIPPERPEPRLAITDIELNATGAIFRFRVDSYLNERHVEFRYRLDGLTSKWTEPMTIASRELHFNSLPAGDFRLHLIAFTPDGRMSREIVSGVINVPTPLYARPWFIITALLIGVTMAFGLFVNAAQRRYSHRLELKVRERTSDLAASERIAQQEREQLVTTMQSIADGVAAAREDGRVFLWNQAAEQLTGITSDDAIGRDIHELLDLPERPAGTGSTRLRLSDGKNEQESFEAMVAPFGEGKQIVVAFRDIRQRVADERDLAHRQRLESLGLLAGGIAHDFNNYLTVILGTLTMLESDKALSEEQRSQVQTASATINRAEELTQQLLTFSTGGAPVRSTVDLVKLSHDAIAIALSGSQITANVIAADDLPPAKIDKGQVSQVLHNLLLNARQAMSDGGNITVNVATLITARKDLEAGAWLAIKVTDNGPGMPADVKQRIFDPFYSGRGSTGLGLAVAHSIVTRHGGSISVQSEQGFGTTFELLLPVSHDAIQADTPAPAESAPKSLRILIMDDEPTIRRLFHHMLGHLGHDSVEVPDGATAVEQFSQAIEEGQPFDLAMFDLTVAGGVGGREAASLVLASHPNAKLIAVSGYSTDSVLGQYADSGFCDAMAKPFSLDSLKQTLERVSRSGA